MRNTAIFLILSLSPFAKGHAVDSFASLSELDIPNPYCEGRTNLDVASEYFVEIANEVPGREEYNKIIKLYRRKDWARLDEAVETFRQVFETSPLMEALTFLNVQSHFERVDEVDSPAGREAEKLLREAFILYPKSTLGPVMTGSVASFWMKKGLNQKSLAMYTAARQDYPFHALNCVFLLGIGENNFVLHDWDAATKTFKEIEQKCDNARVNVGAKIRLADMELKANSKVAQAAYEKLYQDNGQIIDWFYPMTLYNLGEMKYRAKIYKSAKFYFNEFIRHKAKEDVCYAYALKRTADIAFRTGAKKQDVVGAYLAVHDQLPLSDLGRFSYIHALLLEINSVAPAERERRLKIIEEESEKIKVKEVKSLAYLEKGLAILDGGERSALNYLVKLNTDTSFSLEKGEIAPFVRDRLLNILEKEAEGAASKETTRAERKDKRIFEPIEAAYPVWLKGTQYDERAKNLYIRMIIRRFKESLASGDMKAALEKLYRWQKSELWPKKGVAKGDRLAVGKALTRYYYELEGDERTKVSKEFEKQSALLGQFLEPEFRLLGVAVALETGNESNLEYLLNKENNKREISSLDSSMPKDLQSYLWIQKGLGLQQMKKYKEAEKAFLQVKDSEQMSEALRDRLNLADEAKEYSKVIQLGLQVLPKLEESEKLECLEKMAGAIQAAKLWNKGSELLQSAVKAKISPKDLAKFHFLAGRSNYELTHWKASIKEYEEGIKLNPADTAKIEAQYRLGKSYLKEKRKAEAKKSLEEVVAAKDSFWSPLAQNELYLLESK